MGEVMTAQVFWDTASISVNWCLPSIMTTGAAKIYTAEQCGEDSSTPLILSGYRRGGFP